jgi:hypothetical protein
MAVRALCVVAAVVWPLIAQASSDTHHDWVILKAGWAGLDYSLSVFDLALHLDVPGGPYPTLPGARPPGFFVVYAFGLPSQALLVGAVAVANAAALAYLSRGNAAIAAILLLLLQDSLTWVNPATTWAALIVLTWNHIDRSWIWGIPLGIAAALRLWPLLPLAYLLMTRRRTGWGALGIFAGLTAFGLLVVPISQAVDAINGAVDWADILINVSISAFLNSFGVPFAVTIAVGSLAALWIARKAPIGYGIAVISGVLLSPLGWPEYFSATTPLWLGPRSNNASTLTEDILPLDSVQAAKVHRLV